MDVAIVFGCWALLIGALVAKLRQDKKPEPTPEELEPPREADWDHINAMERDLGMPVSERPVLPKPVNHGTGQVIAGTPYLLPRPGGKKDQLNAAADVVQILKKEVQTLHAQVNQQDNQISNLKDKLDKKAPASSIEKITTEQLIAELQARGVMRHSSRTVAATSAESFQVTKGAHTNLISVLVTDTFQLDHYELLELNGVVHNYTHNPMLDPRRRQVEMLVLELRSLLKTFQTPNPFGVQTDADILSDQLKTVEFFLRQIAQYSGVQDAHLHGK